MVLDIEDACKKVEDQRKEDKKEVKRLETLIKEEKGAYQESYYREIVEEILL